MVNNIPVTHKPEELRLMLDNTVKSFLDPVLVSLMKKEVNKSKDADEPVNRAFEVIAEKSGLKFNTVRNYYYRYIHEKDKKQGSSGMDHGDAAKGSEVAGTTFKVEEVKELMTAMLVGQAQGKSVRGCANELARNDKRLLLRYQNKYRNVISGNPEYVRDLMKQLSAQGLVYYDPYRKQIVHGQATTPEGELFDSLGRLVSNINEIRNTSVDGLLRGLQALSEMAVKYERQCNTGTAAGDLPDYENLVAINRNFLKLSPAGKLTGLSEYIRQLDDCINGMEAGRQIQ